MAGGLSPKAKAYTTIPLLDHSSTMPLFLLYLENLQKVYALCVGQGLEEGSFQHYSVLVLKEKNNFAQG